MGEISVDIGPTLGDGSPMYAESGEGAGLSLPEPPTAIRISGRVGSNSNINGLYRLYLRADHPKNKSGRPAFRDKMSGLYLYYVPTEWSKKKHENMWRIGPLCWPENKRSPFYALLRSDTDFQTQPAGVNIEIHKNKQWVPDDSIKIELIFGTVKGRKKQAEHKITRNPHPISGKGWLTRRIFLFTGQRPLLTLTVLNLLNMLVASAIYTHLELDYEREQTKLYHATLSDFQSLLNFCTSSAQNTGTRCSQGALNRSTEIFMQANSYAIGPTEEDDWSFGGSFLFTLTVSTTVGYGMQAPATNGGRWFTVFYMFVGIPIMLAWFGVMGEHSLALVHRVMTEFFKSKPQVCKVCNGYGRDKDGDECIACHGTGHHVAWEPPGWLVQFSATAWIFVYILAIMGPLYMSLANAYPNGVTPEPSDSDKWDYSEAVYFAAVTYSTVGFGDYSFGANVGAGVYIVNVIGMLLGMTLFATILASLQEQVEKLEHGHLEEEETEEINPKNQQNQAAKSSNSTDNLANSEPIHISSV